MGLSETVPGRVRSAKRMEEMLRAQVVLHQPNPKKKSTSEEGGAVMRGGGGG